jgi:hypothetical protein
MESRETAAVRYRFKTDHARQVERVLQWLGWTVAVLANVSLVGFVGCIHGCQGSERGAGSRSLPRPDGGGDVAVPGRNHG